MFVMVIVTSTNGTGALVIGPVAVPPRRIDVPSGATFDSAGTESVDESKVKAIPDHPKPAAKKKAAKIAQ